MIARMLIFPAAVSFCTADKRLYRLVFNPSWGSRSGGGDAAVVDAGAARRGVVSQRQLEKPLHVPVRHF